MRTITNIEKITIKVTNDDLIEGEWIPYTVLSEKVKEIEMLQNMTYKSLRVKLYNSCSLGKYNTATRAGVKCINVKDTMKSNSASLYLTFVKE